MVVLGGLVVVVVVDEGGRVVVVVVVLEGGLVVVVVVLEGGLVVVVVERGCVVVDVEPAAVTCTVVAWLFQWISVPHPTLKIPTFTTNVPVRDPAAGVQVTV